MADKKPGVTVSVVLRHDQTYFLDAVSLAIRKKSQAHVNRSAIIRGLIDWLKASKIDLSRASNENDVSAILQEKTK